MRFAIAGLGAAAHRGHLPAIGALAPRATVVAAADTDPRSRERFTQTHAGVPTFASVREMLGAVACDVLVITTDPQAHAELVALGVCYGRHVVCEKPLTLTRSEHEQIVAACARWPDLALVPVHQYGHSAHWQTVARRLRAAIVSRCPYELTVEIRRTGPDPYARSAWRRDPARSGGMLADSGVHFLALAWRVHDQLELITAYRDIDTAGHEDAAATYRLGSGIFTIHTCNSAPSRVTEVRLRVGPLASVWHDDVARLEIDQRVITRHRVDALSDRAHVDALYRPLYHDVLDHLAESRWRAHRTHEALAVSHTLLSLLEQAVDR